MSANRNTLLTFEVNEIIEYSLKLRYFIFAICVDIYVCFVGLHNVAALGSGSGGISAAGAAGAAIGEPPRICRINPTACIISF